MPLNENKLPKPLSPYGASKLAGEGYCSAYSSSYNLNTVVLRFSNVYGPISYQKGSVIPKFTKQIFNGNDIIIYGDGKQTRDFIYVTDICEAIHLSLTTELNNKFELFQIATGTEVSINQLLELISKDISELGYDTPEIIYKKFRDGEIIRNYADISKAENFLGFHPDISLKDGLKKTIKWFIDTKYY